MNNILRRLAKIGGSAAVASALMLSVTMPAHANMAWRIEGASWIWLTSSTYPNGRCVAVDRRTLEDPVNSPFNTLVFPTGSCTSGAGKQCRSTVRSAQGAILTFDASMCLWRR